MVLTKKGNENVITLSVKVSEQLKAELLYYLEHNDRALSYVIRQAITEYLICHKN